MCCGILWVKNLLNAGQWHGLANTEPNSPRDRWINLRLILQLSGSLERCYIPKNVVEVWTMLIVYAYFFLPWFNIPLWLKLPHYRWFIIKLRYTTLNGTHLEEQTARNSQFVFCFRRYSPQWASAPTFLRFLITHNNAPHSLRLLWKSAQLVAETSTWQLTIFTAAIHAFGEIRTRNEQERGRRPTL
jgi:hypothetical protein